jgi:hypothetical protein
MVYCTNFHKELKLIVCNFKLSSHYCVIRNLRQSLPHDSRLLLFHLKAQWTWNTISLRWWTRILPFFSTEKIIKRSQCYRCLYFIYAGTYLIHSDFNEVQLWNYAETEHHKTNDKFHVHSWVNIPVIQLSQNGVKSLGMCYFIDQKFGYVTEQF